MLYLSDTETSLKNLLKNVNSSFVFIKLISFIDLSSINELDKRESN